MDSTLQTLFRTSFPDYARHHRLPLHYHRAARAIIHCRTAALGGHVQRCPEGHVAQVWYNSCKNRNCPQCAYLARERWLVKQQALLLDCDHYHVIFTIPSELHPLWCYNRRRLMGLLFDAAHETLFELLADAKYLGALPGLISTLHTWGRNLCLHPHVHCLITGGGLDGTGQWRGVSRGFLLPSRVVMPVFRGKLLAGLRQGLARGELVLPPDWAEQATINQLNRLGRKKWNVHIRERYAHGRGVMNYLSRYVKGGPISNRRLSRCDATQVGFYYVDHRDGKTHEMRLQPDQFIQRYLQHVAEVGSHTTRYYGLYAHGQRSKLQQARACLGQAPYEPAEAIPWQRVIRDYGSGHPGCCPVCGQWLMAQPARQTATGPPGSGNV